MPTMTHALSPRKRKTRIPQNSERNGPLYLAFLAETVVAGFVGAHDHVCGGLVDHGRLAALLGASHEVGITRQVVLQHELLNSVMRTHAHAHTPTAEQSATTS